MDEQDGGTTVLMRAHLCHPDTCHHKNSSTNAIAGHQYQPVSHPRGQKAMSESVNMWAEYVRVWGDRQNARIVEMEEFLASKFPGEFPAHPHDHPQRTHIDGAPHDPYEPGPT
jgi:hypothetical protein